MDSPSLSLRVLAFPTTGPFLNTQESQEQKLDSWQENCKHEQRNASMGQEREELMSYIERTLQPGERLYHTAKASVLPYLPGMIGGLVLIPSSVWYPAPYFAGSFSIFGAFVGVLFTALWLSTELSITNRRVVVKTGLVSRTVRELHLSRIEGVDVEQTILGRFLRYGTVLVRGVGTDLDPIAYVADPERFKRAFFEASPIAVPDQSSSGAASATS